MVSLYKDLNEPYNCNILWEKKFKMNTYNVTLFT